MSGEKVQRQDGESASFEDVKRPGLSTRPSSLGDDTQSLGSRKYRARLAQISQTLSDGKFYPPKAWFQFGGLPAAP